MAPLEKTFEARAKLAKAIQNTVDLGYPVEAGSPFSIWFVFPRNANNFVVKGSVRQCRDFVSSRVPQALCHKLVFHTEYRQQVVSCDAEIIGLNENFMPVVTFVDRTNNAHRCHRRRWNITIYNRNYGPIGYPLFFKDLKRLPKMWPVELDAYLQPPAGLRDGVFVNPSEVSEAEASWQRFYQRRFRGGGGEGRCSF
jgi:hypothetical protein